MAVPPKFNIDGKVDHCLGIPLTTIIYSFHQSFTVVYKACGPLVKWAIAQNPVRKHSHYFILNPSRTLRATTQSGTLIITELETLKEEAAEVQRKMEETDTVMAEVDRVSQQYLPLCTSCSAMYFTLESLNQVVDLRLNSSSQGLISHSYTEDL
uniref:Uncharacterized protein n=1 Tax=Amphimedon queenslandica TaxID=400682 RepID=A0A1X7TG47_AMPQE